MATSEAIDYVKKPTEEFIRDSWRLVKRCTKPDRTGAHSGPLANSSRAPASRPPRDDTRVFGALLRPLCLASPLSRRASHRRSAAVPAPLSARGAPCTRRLVSSGGEAERPSPRVPRRVLKDRSGHLDRLCDHGLHWLLREAHLHPDQQHHSWHGMSGGQRHARAADGARAARRSFGRTGAQFQTGRACWLVGSSALCHLTLCAHIMPMRQCGVLAPRGAGTRNRRPRSVKPTVIVDLPRDAHALLLRCTECRTRLAYRTCTYISRGAARTQYRTVARPCGVRCEKVAPVVTPQCSKMKNSRPGFRINSK